jgi:hypothetical protein
VGDTVADEGLSNRPRSNLWRNATTGGNDDGHRRSRRRSGRRRAKSPRAAGIETGEQRFRRRIAWGGQGDGGGRAGGDGGQVGTRFDEPRVAQQFGRKYW